MSIADRVLEFVKNVEEDLSKEAVDARIEAEKLVEAAKHWLSAHAHIV